MPSSIKKRVVGIGTVCAEAGQSEMVAFALGSCIALCLYDAEHAVGAMAHILLPSRAFTGHGDAAFNTKYADHALTAALTQMLALGAAQSRVAAAIIGEARMFPHGDCSSLNIGEMNTASVKEELQKRQIPLLYAAVGGEKSRTVAFRIPGPDFASQITIRSPQKLGT